MDKRCALIFPGQGAQYVGMGKDFFDAFSVARETFEEADEILGFSLTDLIFNGPAEELVQTKNSQVAIYVMSLALYRVLKQQLPDLERIIFRIGRRGGTYRSTDDLKHDPVTYGKIKGLFHDIESKEGIAGVEKFVTDMVDRYV